MSTVTCPVCGELTELDSRLVCMICGSLLPKTLIQDSEDADLKPSRKASKANKKSGRDAEQVNEIEQAFRYQFEQRKIHAPATWTDKMHRLAMEAEASRRQATVIFVDLRGYTRLSQIFDELQMRELRSWFFDLCTRIIELHGGFIIQFLGDAALAVFGAPYAFERDSESALQSLLDIRNEIRQRGKFLGQDIAIRAGAHTGTVHVQLTKVHGENRLDIFGSTVNLAARLEARAETWEILISDTLAEQMQGLFILEARTAFKPKNYNREVNPWSVQQHKGDEALRRSHDVPFIGREKELAQLQKNAEQIINGEFVALELTGDAGVGKTRLIDEFVHNLPADKISVYKADCQPHERHQLLGVLLQILESIIRNDSASSKDSKLSSDQQLEVLKKILGSENEAIIPGLGYMLGVKSLIQSMKTIPSSELRNLISACIFRLLEVISKQRPTILLIDNVQWSDILSQDTLSMICSNKPSGLMILMICRLEDSSGLKPWENMVQKAEKPTLEIENCENIELTPLSKQDQEKLLETIIDIETMHPSIVKNLLRGSEGIPLYLIEYAQQTIELLDDDQELSKVHQAMQRSADSVPPSLIELLQSRVDNLGTQRRAVLQCSAVLGHRFSYGMIQFFESIHENLLSQLYALKGLRMLSEFSMPDDMGFLFNPTFLRDITYRMLTGEQQKEMHRIVAEKLEKNLGDSIDQFAYELAYHYIHAENLNSARPYMLKTCKHAIRYGSPQDAFSLITPILNESRIQQLLSSESMTTAETIELQQLGMLEEIAGQSLFLMSEYQNSSDHYQWYLKIAEKLRNSRWIFKAQIKKASNAIDSDNPIEAMKILDSLEDLQSYNLKQQLEILVMKGSLSLRNGELKQALEHFLEVVNKSNESKNTYQETAYALNNVGLVYWHQDQLEKAKEVFKQAIETSKRLNDSFALVSEKSNLGIIYEKQGDWSHAKILYSEALQSCESIGYMHGISAIEANRANLSIFTEDWAMAQKQSARALHFARLVKQKKSEAIALENLALAQAGLGLMDEAYLSFAEAMALSQEMADPIRSDSATLGEAWIALMNGNTERAQSSLENLSENPTADIQTWSQLITTTLEVLQGNQSAEIIGQELTTLKDSAHSEEYLRQLDVLILLGEKNKTQHNSQHWQTLRRDWVLQCLG